MSNTVDNKVVEMRFDNQQFEKNADKTISTLDRLKQALKFDNTSTKSLDDVGRSAKNINLDSLAKSVDSVSDRFSNMGIVGITVLQRLTNAAIDAGIKMVKSFAGGGVDSGFNKYSSKMEAVQVMAINTGKTIEEINPVLAQLQHYTDETSYHYEEMIRAMAKFTGSGIELEVAEESVQGIANWAATAGVNVENAAAAFDVMSKAMANDFLSLQDAYTLNRLNMFTPDARKLILETAAAMGTVRKEGDKYFATVSTGAKKAKEVEVTTADFMQTLGKGKWATREVWEEFLHLYNATAEELSEYDKAILESVGLTDAFGEKAYDAAYQAKTFSDALGAVKESISTGWANSFEIIFGNYEEAARLWTAGCELVIEFTAAISDERNAILEEWRALKGRNELVNAMVNILTNLARVITPIKAAFSEAFPAITGERIVELTKRFNEFLISIRPSYKTVSNIAIAFKGLFDVISFGIDIVKTFVSTIFSFLSPGKDLLDTISGIAAFLGSLLSVMTEVARESGVIELIVGSIIGVISTLLGVLSTLLGILVQVGTAIYNFLKKVKELPAVKNAIDGISAAFEKVKKSVPEILDRIVTGFNNLIDKANKLKDSGMTPFFENLNSSIATFWGWITKAKDKLVEFVDFVLQKFGVVDASKDTINGLTTSFSELLNKLGNKELSDALERTGEAAEETGKKFTWLKFAMAAGGAAVVSNVLGIGNAFGKANKNVGETSGLFDNLLSGFGGIAKKAAIVGGLGAGAVLLYKKLSKTRGDDQKNIFGSIDEEEQYWRHYAATVTEASKQIEKSKDSLIIVEESVDGINDAVTRSGGKAPSFFEKLGSSIAEFGSKVTGFFSPALVSIGEFIKTLNVGKLVVIGFVGSLVGILAQFAITIGTLPLLMLSLTKSLWTLGNAIGNWSIWGVDTFGDTCMKIGQALIYFAGALLMISAIPKDRFMDVMSAAKDFIFVMGYIATASTVIGLIRPGGLQYIWEFGLAIMSLGASAVLFAAGMSMLAKLNVGQIFSGAIAIVASIGIIAMIMSKLGILTPLLKAGEIHIKGMVATLVALAGALFLIGKLMTPEQLTAASTAMFGMLSVITVFTAVMGKFGPPMAKAMAELGVGILAISASVIAIIYALKLIESLKGYQVPIEGVVLVVVALAATIAMLKVATMFVSKDAAQIAVAAFAISASVLALVYSFKLIGEVSKSLSGEQIGAGLIGIAFIAAGLAGVFLALSKLGKTAFRSSLALIPVTITIVALIGIGMLLATIDDEFLTNAIGRLAIFIGAIFVLFQSLRAAYGIKPGPILALVAAIGVITASLILLSTFTEADEAGKAAASIGAVLIAFAVALRSASGFKKGFDLKIILYMIGAIVAIAAAIGLISKFGGDWASIAAAAGGLSISLLALAGTIGILSRIPVVNPEVLAVIPSMIGAIIAIGASLMIISAFGKDSDSILSACVALGATLLAFSAAMLVLSYVPVANAALIPIIIAMIAATAAIGLVLSQLAQYDWEMLKGAVMGFGATMLILIGAVALLGALGSIGIGEIGAGILIAIAVAMGIFAAASIGFAFAATLVANAIMTITQALTILGTIGPEAAENIRNTLVQVGAGLGEGVATMVLTFITTLIPGIAAALGVVVGLFKGVGEDIDRATALGLEENAPLVYDAAANTIEQADSGLQKGSAQLVAEAAGIGRDVTSAISGGLSEDEIYSIFYGAGTQTEEGFRDGAEWHSCPHWLSEFFKDWGIGIDENASWIEVKNAVVGAMAGGALGKNFQASSIPFINQVMSLLAQAEGSINIFGQRVKANATNAVKNAKNTIESAKEAFSGKKLTKEDWDALHPQPLDITPPGGSGGGGGGGGGSAKEEAKELFDVMTDGKDIIEKHIELFGKLHTKLGYTQPMDLAKSAVQKLAESIYASSVKMVDAETQAAKATEDKLAEMKEAFDAFVSDVANSVSGQVDVWGSLTYAQATATKDWDKNFKNQQKLVNEWKRSLIMIARRVSPEFLQEIVKMGPEMTLQVLEWASLTDEGLKRVEDRYLGHEEYVKNTLEEVLAIAAQSAEGMTKATDSWVSSLGVAIEYSGDAAKAAGEVAKGVVDANKKMGESATEYAKVTDQMAAKAVKAYYDIKQQVEDTINNSIDLFTKFEEKDEEDVMSVDDMTEAAQSQLHAWTKWGDLMAKLQAKNPAEGLLNKFMNGGVDMLGELENVVNASESEFQTLNACFEQLETFASDIGGKVGMAGANAAIMFSDGFLNNINTEGSKQAVTTMVQNVVDALIGQIEDENAGVIPIGTTVDEKISEGIKDSADSVNTALTETVSGASDAGDDVAKDRSYTMGGYFPAGVAQGIADGTWQVTGAVVTMVEEAYQAGMDASMSASPSKLFAKLGGYFGQGLAQGMDGEAAAIDESSRTLAERAYDATKAVVDHIQSILNGEVNVDPTIRPVLDTSEIEAGMSSVDSMFNGRSYSLSRGMEIQNSSDSIRDLIAQTMASMNANTPQPAYAGPPINMYVYGAEGQDEEEIANIVESRLMHRINMRGGTWR